MSKHTPGQPDRIWARLDAATVYMDGSSPLVARTREFRGAEEYILADAARDMLAALNEAADFIQPFNRAEELLEKIEAAIAKAEGRS